LIAAATPWAARSQTPAADAAPVDIGSRLELFLDDTLVGALRGAELKLHEPRPAGTVLRFEKPWEGVTSLYITVFKDEDRYRMYYRGSSHEGYTVTSALKPGESVIPEHDQFACYAESRDGITWTRPSLGLVPFKGSKENNIVWTGPGAHNFNPFRDPNAADPAQRYKAVGSGSVGKKPVLFGFGSPDGLRWTLLRQEPIITDGAFDSLNVAFWDPVKKVYAAIYRDFTHGVRTIKYATSTDFLSWTPGQWADFGDSPAEHLYTNGAVPYFRAPHVYVALPRRFIPWRTYYKELMGSGSGLSDVLLMSSRDGVRWHRFDDAYIRPGLDERNWVHRTNEPAAGIVPTGPDEMSIYVARNYTWPTNHLERMALRTDGFVSVHAGSTGGELVTKPLVFKGGNLVLNYSTSASGSIQLEIQDARGKPLPGFALQDSPLIWGDKVEAVVKWRDQGNEMGSAPLRRHAGEPVRLRFVLKDADLYSIRFR
jgi:hypothetical protein